MKRLLLLLFALVTVIGVSAWGGDESPPVPLGPVIEQHDAINTSASPVEIAFDIAGEDYSPHLIKGESIITHTFQLRKITAVKNKVRWHNHLSKLIHNTRIKEIHRIDKQLKVPSILLC